MRLERGATGFRDRGEAELPRTDPAAFRGACWEAARRAGGTVGGPDGAGVAGFLSATIRCGAREHVVLGHPHLRVVAFADAPVVPGGPVPVFNGPPGWAVGFEVLGFDCLTAEELGTPLSEADLGALSRAEHAQIRHWRPDTVGELLFNSWD
ncbi:hypothetical protein ACWFMI_16135 [Nocardiopsis terrae]